MNSVLQKIFIITFTCLSILPFFAGSASAHRVNVFAWVEGDTIFVESKFSGGKKVKAGMLAQLHQKGPTAGDIFAGIGYIFGLVGIAALVHSRKKKE